MAGILSFGQAALFGIGGYVYGIIAINSGLPLLGLLAGIAAPAAVAAVLGYVSFYGRIAPMFFAVITLIVALILYQVMGSTADPRYAIGAARLGGYNGMTMVPTPGGELPFLSGAPLSPSGLLYLVGGLLLAVLAFCIALTRSSFGRILQGIRENEQRAELLGFDIRWRKTAIFTLAGAIAGLAGGLFAAWGNFINPEVFSLPQAALVVIWVLVGGRGTLYGAVLGAVAVQLLSSYLGAAGSTYTTLLLGTALLVIVLFFKEAGAGAVAANPACAEPPTERQQLITSGLESSAMLTPATSYEEAYGSFRWQIPGSYNIGCDVCDRHAGDPTRRALIYEDAAGQVQEYTFLEIMRRANRLANALAAQGLGRGDRIGILLPQSPEAAIAHVATYKMGAIAVPLFTLFGADALEYRLADSGARALVDRENLAKIETIRDRLPDLAAIVGTDIPTGHRESGLLAWRRRSKPRPTISRPHRPGRTTRR